MRFSFAHALWAIAAACQIAASPAGAGSLEVAPTTLTLQPGAMAGVLYINNYGSTPVTIQVEPFNWSQIDGRDQLTPSDALLVSPPIAAIAAQEKQIVRLMIAPSASGGERSFRLLVSELPDPAKHADHSVQVLTQFSLPVFTAGAAEDSVKLVWSAALNNKELELTARNDGARHAKLADLKIILPSGDARLPAGNGLDYILAGSARSWKASCGRCAAGDALRVEAVDEVSGAKLDDSLLIGR